MNKIIVSLISLGLCVTASALDPVKAPAPAVGCIIDGKPTDPKFTADYEGQKYRLCSDECSAKWKAERAASLYEQIGGKPAVQAAVKIFYTKVLADDRIKQFFADVDMVRQAAKQESFLSAALGSPVKYTGRDLRKAHEKLPGLNDTHFNAVAENLQATLVELKLKKEIIDRILAILETVRADVLNKAK